MECDLQKNTDTDTDDNLSSTFKCNLVVHSICSDTLLFKDLLFFIQPDDQLFQFIPIKSVPEHKTTLVYQNNVYLQS